MKNTKKVKSVEYDRINKALTRLELGKYPIHSESWCSNRIAWAWKFRKISKEQMEELTERMTQYYKDKLTWDNYKNK